MTTTRQTFRSFAFGFVLGAIAIAMTVGRDHLPNVAGQMVPAAIAAPVR